MEIFSARGFDLGEECLHIPACWLADKFAIVFLKVMAEKLKTIFNVRDASFTL